MSKMIDKQKLHHKVFERMNAEVPQSRAGLGGYHTGKRDAYLNVIADLQSGQLDESPDLIRTALLHARDALYFITLPHLEEEKLEVAKESYEAVKSVLESHDKWNPPVDYQQRYEALVQAIRNGYMFSESANGLIHQIESTTDFRLREDDSND